MAGARDDVNVLTFNAGSSSLKVGIYSVDGERARSLFARTLSMEPTAAGATAAINAVLASELPAEIALDAVGHRLVFGGPDDAPTLASPALFDRLARYERLDPLHAPAALAALRTTHERLAHLPNVLCFDTNFFRELPARARVLPIENSEPDFLRRYGFHGLSYEYVRATLGTRLGSRAILAHLGSGASLAALRDGKPIECTMGFSPLGGILMATRPGDLDPGVLLYLLEERQQSVADLRRLLEERSGLRALSGGERDLRHLLERGDDPRAVLAVDAFCTSVVKAVGALAALLGGLDTLVFTGGVGEHLAPIRSSIVRGLALFGMKLDIHANEIHADVISLLSSAVTVRVVTTDENATIARATSALVHANAERTR
ncbi:MAG: acetate/propionate family kinase [Candidatus Eremiobacteraeota bacterium]|nr:acetate/propionate family kinase [Candidatus Eremiobacteraeota bacterium]NNM92258.1 acetate/propionate family kinase [Candidatus Eremiobacteraeota bacterium]